MKQSPLRFALAALLSCPLLVAPLVHATSVLTPNFSTMVRQSDLIFTGHAVNQRSEWRQIDGQRSIVTLVTFQVEATHKGRAGRTVDLQFLGGTVGNTSLEVAEMPKFKLGERVVLFVEKNGENASPLVGFYQGKFRLQKDGAAREIVVGAQGPVADVNEIGRRRAMGTAPSRALSHEEFAAKIREASLK